VVSWSPGSDLITMVKGRKLIPGKKVLNAESKPQARKMGDEEDGGKPGTIKGRTMQCVDLSKRRVPPRLWGGNESRVKSRKTKPGGHSRIKKRRSSAGEKKKATTIQIWSPNGSRLNMWGGGKKRGQGDRITLQKRTLKTGRLKSSRADAI